MKSIIIYDTATGNTRKIAEQMKNVLKKYNHDCDLYRDKEIRNKIENKPDFFEPYALVGLGSCTHGGVPAKTFKKFMEKLKNFKLSGKFLVCFSSSGGPDSWEGTCSEIQKEFPDMKHLGNFGCQSKKLESTIKEFEELVKNLS